MIIVYLKKNYNIPVVEVELVIRVDSSVLSKGAGKSVVVFWVLGFKVVVGSFPAISLISTLGVVTTFLIAVVGRSLVIFLVVSF